MDYRLPYYMAYPMPYLFDDEKIERRDFDYLKSMYPMTVKNLLPYIEEECEQNERKTIMDLYKKFNRTIYHYAGTLQADQSNTIDECIQRLIKAGNILRSDIVVEYEEQSKYIFYIRNEVYSICYSSIISSINEGGE